MNILFVSDFLKNSSIIPDFFTIEQVASPNYNENLDVAITNYLHTLNNKRINSITLPISLGDNFLELTGLRIAYHIRLSKELSFREVPLIFFGSVDINTIAKLSPLASLLFTQKVNYVNINEFSFDKIVESIKTLDSKKALDFDKFLEFINIEPPANYQSSHSVANDWALARYFSVLEKDEKSDTYLQLKKKVENLDYINTLHFKYNENRSDREKFNRKKHSYTPLIRNIDNLTIGIIEDESDKGWGEFYNYLLGKSKAKTVNFQFYKEESKLDLLTRLKLWVDSNNSLENPIDIYIVDLRLHDDDFNEKRVNEITGNLIIDYIKSINKGTQIVISTASNKVWNFQKNINVGVSSFVVKESPESFSNRNETKSSLINLANNISDASEKAFLATLYRKVKEIKENHNIKSEETEFIDTVFAKNGLLDKILELLILDSENEAVLNQSLLLCFQILEIYCDLKSIASFGGSRNLSSGFIWDKEGNNSEIFINKPNSKIHTLFELKMGKFDFQEDNSSTTPVGYTAYPKMEYKNSFKSGLDSSSLVKIISVLHFREKINKNKIERIIKLRYYRSNVAAHFTNRVKPNYKITAKDDIVFLVGVLEEIFLEMK